MDTPATPLLKRRLAAMVYEAVLLFGVIFFAEAVLLIVVVGFARIPIDTFAHSAQASMLQQLWIFVVLGIYFVYFWRKNGQTLPMQTWRIRLVAAHGIDRVPAATAVARYLLTWMWFIPGWFVGHLFGMSREVTIGLIAVNVVVWATTSKLGKDGQFLHDRLAGTRLISTLPPDQAPSA